MDYRQGKYPIISKKNLAKDIYDFTIQAAHLVKDAAAGQFVHVKADGFFLRRPISICAIDKDAGTLRIVFEVRGEGTKALARLNEGELMDIIGPLGKGFSLLDPGKKAIVVGGGIGVPPMLETAKQYAGNCRAVLGFRNASAVILSEDFSQNGNEVCLCTDDGTLGRKGYVTEALKECLKSETPDIIYACGPSPMLRGVAELAKQHGVSCEVSLEERMGCGVGACLVCACRAVKDGEAYFAHVCKDGPVFPAEQVL